MIFTERTITIRNDSSTMNAPVILYRGDKNVEVRFTLVESPYKYSNRDSINIIESTDASYAQLVIKTPNDRNPIFGDITAVGQSNVIFMIGYDMIDEIEEVGTYDFQIRLFDANQTSMATIPEVTGGFIIKEPIAKEDTTNNITNSAIVGSAVVTSDVSIPTFVGGSYNKTAWYNGTVISRQKLDKIEDGIYETYELSKTNNLESIKKGYATLSDFDEETRLAIQGINPGNINAVLGFHNVKKENISYKAVYIENISFFTAESENVLSKYKIKEHGFYNPASNNTWINRDDIFTIDDFININGSDIIFANAYSMYFYDADKNYLTEVKNNGSNTFKIPDNCVYIRPNYKYETANTTDAYLKLNSPSNKFWSDDLVVKTKNLILDDNSISNEKLQCLKPADSYVYKDVLSKYKIKEHGFYNPASNNTWINRDDIFTTEDFIDVSGMKNITSNAYSIYFYDKNKNYIGETKSTSETQLIDNCNYIRANYKYATTSIENAYLKLPFNKYEFTDDIVIKSDTNANISNNPKFMHLSSDDVLTMFKDIVDNNRASIFDNTALKFLKRMHDTYGMVFSCYCFYTNADNTFNLTMMPDTYKNEFIENADWLKFGVHYYKNGSGNFNTIDADTGLTYYQQIITELFRITGSFNSIDTAPRFHNYAGTLDVIQKIYNENLGITGLITTEDTRTSYYLDTTKNTYMQKHDNMVDYNNGIKFFSTDLRLENISNPKAELESRLANIEYASRMKELVIFTHEPYLSQAGMQSKIEACCKFAVENGYSFDFPMNRI